MSGVRGKQISGFGGCDVRGQRLVSGSEGCTMLRDRGKQVSGSGGCTMLGVRGRQVSGSGGCDVRG